MATVDRLGACIVRRQIRLPSFRNRKFLFKIYNSCNYLGMLS